MSLPHSAAVAEKQVHLVSDDRRTRTRGLTTATTHADLNHRALYVGGDRTAKLLERRNAVVEDPVDILSPRCVDRAGSYIYAGTVPNDYGGRACELRC